MLIIVVAILLAICGIAIGFISNNESHEQIPGDELHANHIAGLVTDFIEEILNRMSINVAEKYECAADYFENNQLNIDFELDNMPVELNPEPNETLQYFQSIDVLVQMMHYFLEHDEDSNSDEELEPKDEEDSETDEEQNMLYEEDNDTDEEHKILYEEDGDTHEEQDAIPEKDDEEVEIIILPLNYGDSSGSEDMSATDEDADEYSDDQDNYNEPDDNDQDGDENDGYDDDEDDEDKKEDDDDNDEKKEDEEDEEEEKKEKENKDKENKDEDEKTATEEEKKKAQLKKTAKNADEAAKENLVQTKMAGLELDRFVV